MVIIFLFVIGSGALITTESVDAGSLLFQHPLREPTKYNKLRDQLDVTFGDKTFKMTCCTGYVQGKDFCLKFFQRRPNNNCSGYRPPVVGKFAYLVILSLEKYRYQEHMRRWSVLLSGFCIILLCTNVVKPLIKCCYHYSLYIHVISRTCTEQLHITNKER